MADTRNTAKAAEFRSKQENRARCPTLVLWGLKGACQTCFDFRRIWKDRAKDVFYKALDTNHYLAEEEPDGTFEALNEFFGA